MLWERPASEVAKELGISDVALGKLCRYLQVPKPPRGYWAKVAAGRTPKRPPLPAYREEVEKRLRKQARPKSQVRLTKLQLEFFKLALDEAAAGGVDTGACNVSFDGIRAIAPDLAAQLILLIQNRYDKWLSDRKTATSVNGALHSLSNLVDKLLPHAKEQLLVFQRRSHDRQSSLYDPSILVRATREFLEKLAHLSRLARTNGLEYVVADLSAIDHAWSIKYVLSPGSFSTAKTTLCVSANEAWVQADMSDLWGHQQIETNRISLRDICPIDLIPANEQKIPSKIRRSTVKPYKERLEVLLEAERLFDSLSEASYEMERTVPDERLAIFDRIWFSGDTSGPFITARQAWRTLESDLERWEEALEREKSSLCQDVLGINTGDIVLVELGGKLVRIAVERMTVYAGEKDLLFNIGGRRFRKDGLLGKRYEQYAIIVENDSHSM